MAELHRRYVTEAKPTTVMDFDGYRIEFPSWWFNVRNQHRTISASSSRQTNEPRKVNELAVIEFQIESTMKVLLFEGVYRYPRSLRIS